MMPRGVRSRNGCARCKAQRLKCDEAWPACGRCSRLGTHCSGPALRLRWSDKHEVLNIPERCRGQQSTSSTQQTHVIRDSSPTSPWPSLNEDAQRILHSYLNTMPVLDDDQNDDRVEQILELAPPGQILFDGDSLPHANSPQPTLSLTDNALPGFEASNGCTAVVNPTELLEAPSPLHQAEDIATSLLEDCPVHLPRQHPHRSVTDYSTMFIEYYFKDAAPLLSMYDSNMNPFRSTVSRLWCSSALIYFTMQSMAAALLSNTYPQMVSVAVRFRQKAVALFHALDESAVNEQALLALFMIGGTASWFNANDTGLEFYISMKGHVQRIAESSQQCLSKQSQLLFNDFFTCWEMFLSFVVDDDKLFFAPPGRITASPRTGVISIFPTAHVPNPLTGVAGDAQAYLIRVGRLVRSSRRRALAKGHLTRALLIQLQDELDEATELEQALFSLQLPIEADVIFTGDLQTPTWHLTAMANVYRQVGLLQLYSVFPDLVGSRMCSEFAEPIVNKPETVGIPMNNANDWLRSIALEIISAMQSIPADSGTKDFQPFLLVASCSALVLPGVTEPRDTIRLSDFVVSSHNMCAEADDVRQAREFLINRLQALQHSLPSKPIQRCVEIVKTTWEMMDGKGSDHRPSGAYWLDVMMERGLETFMA